MAKLSLVKGTTSYLARIFIQDSASTTGAGKTGLTNASSGLVCYRARDDDGNAAGTAISLSAGTRGTWSSGGFVEKDSANMAGVYEFGIPNAALASGSKSVLIMFSGASGMAPLPLEIELTGFDNQSITDGGLSKLTSLTFTGANKVDASVRDWVGDTIPARATTGVPKVDVQNWTGTAVATPATAGVAEVNIKNINNVSAAAVTTVKAVQGLTTADTIATYTGNTVQTGDAYARIGAAGAGLTALGDTRIANLDATISSRTKPADTQAAVTTVTNLTNAPTAGDLTGTMKTSIGTAVAASAVASVTGNVGGNLVGTLSTTERTAIADALLDRNMGTGTDSGSPTVRTVRQALRFLRNKWSISAGTLAVTKEDDTTTSWTGSVTTTAGNPVSTIDPA